MKAYSLYAIGSKGCWMHIGDSTDVHVVQGAICMLRRMGYKVSVSAVML